MTTTQEKPKIAVLVTYQPGYKRVGSKEITWLDSLSFTNRQDAETVVDHIIGSRSHLVPQIREVQVFPNQDSCTTLLQNTIRSHQLFAGDL
jgi:hypothetical protein